MYITKIDSNDFNREDLKGIAKKLYQVIVAVNRLTKAVPATPETAEIDMFAIGDIDGVITGNNIAVTVPNGTVVTALAPTITVTAGATVAPITGVAENFTNPFTYVVTSQNGKITNNYVVTVTTAAASTPAASAQITAFSVGANVGVITQSNIAVSVPTGTDVTALVPTIVTTAGAALVPNNTVPQDFTSPVTYTVTSADGTAKVSYTVTVTVA